jgi:ribosomal protein S18 acetylase RimI-like enzyme
MSEISLQRAPFPSSFFRQTAIIHCLAFSNSGITSFWSPTPALAKTDTVEEIPPLRLQKTIREHRHRELDPKSVVVCAIIDGEIAGVASWYVPAPLHRSESLAETIYRKGIEYKDALEDWMFPAYWVIPERRAAFGQAQQAAMDKYLGKGKIDETWYLKILGVHPKYQRRGVGAALIDWGLQHARQRGEKVYLEASQTGKALYLKKGFKVVGEFELGEPGELIIPCMLWDPDTAPSQEEIEKVQVGQVGKQA